MNQPATPPAVSPPPVFARIAAGSLWVLLAVTAAVALLFALGAKSINMAGGWGWLLAAALIIALAAIVCAVCAIASAISLIRHEPHRARSIGLLVVCGLIAWVGKDTAIRVVGGLHEVYRQIQKEAERRAGRANPAAAKPPPARSASDATTLEPALLEHFRQRGFTLKPSTVTGGRVEWLLKNVDGGPGCTVQTNFVRFPPGTSGADMRKHLQKINAASVLNEHALLAMFYPSARHLVRGGDNCDGWGLQSGKITAELVEAFESYNQPAIAGGAAISR